MSDRTWERTLSVWVEVPDDWLTDDGNDPREDSSNESWAELLKDLTLAIQYMRYYQRGSAYPKFDVDWETDPKLKEAVTP